MKRRSENTRDLQETISWVLEKEKRGKIRRVTEEEDKQFRVIPSQIDLLHKSVNISGSKELDGVTSWQRFLRGLDIYGKFLRRASQKGVKVRYVCDVPAKGPYPKIFLDFIRKPYFEFKAVSAPPFALFSCNNKEIIFHTSTRGNAKNTPSL